MRVCNRGMMMLLTTAGAFCAFSLMTIAVGTDYWLYSRGMCRSKNLNDNETVHKNEEVLTHSGLWRTCCTEGKTQTHIFIAAFPTVSAAVCFHGGTRNIWDQLKCLPRFSEFYCLSNIIGIIVYISANSGDPSQSDNKKSYSYGWSFYFGALSFVLAEMVGVLAVHVFIEKHRQLRTKGRPSLMKPPVSRNSSSYRNRYYNHSRRYSYRSNQSTADSTSESKVTMVAGLPMPMTMGSEFMLYALASPLKKSKIDLGVEDLTTAAPHTTDMLLGNCVSNRRTTPV
uniref:Voltage-dependent calcium channel gamma-3 subunit n=1 Tax=Poecilia reticulata TaxID=8081 RepID=A0A3P9MTG1_POERE